MKTIIFINNKGGVGKTASVSNTAHILAAKYLKRVLVVDLDPQMNTTSMFTDVDFSQLFYEIVNGTYDGGHAEKSVEDLLLNPEMDVHETIKHTRYPNLDIIPAHLTLSFTESRMASDVAALQQFILKRHLEKVYDEYDYCIIDTSPSLSLININGLVSADEAYIPINTDGGSMLGVANTVAVINKVREYSPHLSLKGIFFTRFNERKNVYEGTMKIENIDLSDIDRNERNFYHVGELDNLKQSIEAIGLKQPLVVKRMPTGRYKLLAGERRLTAIEQLYEENKWGTTVPCVIQDYDKIKLPIPDELKEMYVLITTNREQRKYTDADIMQEIKELKTIYAALRDVGVESFSLGTDEDGNEKTRQIQGVRTRELIADDLKMSAPQVSKFEKVDKKASDALREVLQKQGINIEAAAKAVDLPKEQQNELVERHKEDKKIKPKDVDEFIAEKKQEVSYEPVIENIDTNEVPQENEQPEIKNGRDLAKNGRSYYMTWLDKKQLGNGFKLRDGVEEHFRRK